MADKEFESTVQALFKGMNEFITSKTVVGEAIHAGDTIILPLMDVTFGVGAGAGNEHNRNGGAAGGMGGKMTPSSVLVISGGTTRLVNIKSQDGLAKILDLVPDFVNRFLRKEGEKKEDGAASEKDGGKKRESEKASKAGDGKNAEA